MQSPQEEEETKIHHLLKVPEIPNTSETPSILHLDECPKALVGLKDQEIPMEETYPLHISTPFHME